MIIIFDTLVLNDDCCGRIGKTEFYQLECIVEQ